jgi:uncharacterized protein (DUF1697 family)
MPRRGRRLPHRDPPPRRHRGARGGLLEGGDPLIALLLRGINLGPHKRIAMPELRAALEDAGYAGARTLLASGNVVLDPGRRRPATVARDVERLIRERFGLDVAVVARTAAQLRSVVERDPFGAAVTNPSRYMVAFLEGEPSGPGVDALRGRDDVVLDGEHVYAWLPDGLADSEAYKEMTDRRLGVTTTVRNWNTVLKLLAATAQQSPPKGV